MFCKVYLKEAILFYAQPRKLPSLLTLRKRLPLHPVLREEL